MENRRLSIALSQLNRAIRNVIREVGKGGMTMNQLQKLLRSVQMLTSFVAQMSHRSK